MSGPKAMKHPVLQKFVQGLAEALGEGLHSIVLYGSAARGDFQKATSDLNLIVVLKNLDLASLEAISPAVTHWVRAGQPPPRLFSPEIIAESADVFPIEFLDIQSRRTVLHGPDPFAGLEIHRDHLRLQCERELREKMMRLREGYIQSHGKPRALRDLLTASYSTFVALFRGCLHLHGDQVPVHNGEVVTAFCARAELDRSPLDEVETLKRGEKIEEDMKALFHRYYGELAKAVHSVNRFGSSEGDQTS
jgi:hypothetical protein